jgi:KRAB domain-containing zinc finger protein
MKRHEANPGSNVRLCPKWTAICPDCDFVSKDGKDWKYHRVIVHGDERPFRCEKCPYNTNELGNLRVHEKKHQKNPGSIVKPPRKIRRECPDCDFVTDSGVAWKNHRNQEHGDMKAFHCTLCNYKTNRPEKMCMHIQRHEKNPGSKVKSNQHVEKPCPDCDFVSKTSKDWTQHRKQVHGDEYPYKCSFCSYKADNYDRFWAHEQVHRDRETLICDVPGCSFQTTWKSSMNNHTKAKHLMQGNYDCHVCGHHSGSSHDLLIHMKARHQGDDHDWEECNLCVRVQDYAKWKARKDEGSHVPRNSVPDRKTVENISSAFNDCLIDVHQLMMNF